jgi:opacity protein-like surface antigen
MSVRAHVGGLWLGAVTVLSVYSAAAADLPLRPASVPTAPVAYAPAAIYNWTGFYVGGHLGAGFSDSSWRDPSAGTNNTFNSGAGFLGGAQVGGNLQFNMLVASRAAARIRSAMRSIPMRTGRRPSRAGSAPPLTA